MSTAPPTPDTKAGQSKRMRNHVYMDATGPKEAKHSSWGHTCSALGPGAKRREKHQQQTKMVKTTTKKKKQQKKHQKTKGKSSKDNNNRLKASQRKSNRSLLHTIHHSTA